MFEMYLRVHLDLLLLAVIRDQPGNGSAVIRELRERSGGRFTPSSQLVYKVLHHLERNRLVRRSSADPGHYQLAEAGRRVLRAKRREWESFVGSVEDVLA
jgi:PadR family transcriptional regulator, regulatory protein PadR